mmetsp:Transcript_32982/g.46837  ORF Transcript_32982/g.46837 Transcript_32982/m.46837 type:complete len:91 (-) Transcript_32982:95-367(-)
MKQEKEKQKQRHKIKSTSLPVQQSDHYHDCVPVLLLDFDFMTRSMLVFSSSSYSSFSSCRDYKAKQNKTIQNKKVPHAIKGDLGKRGGLG